MTWSLVGSLGAATQGASGASVNPSYGQTPTAGNVFGVETASPLPVSTKRSDHDLTTNSTPGLMPKVQCRSNAL